MTKLCVLITKPPHSDERAEHICGISKRAKEREMDVSIYFLGDGVLCTKKGQKGYIGQNMKVALQSGVTLKASANDLRARAMPPEQVESGIEIIDDLEGEFVDDIMENADRVISW